MRGETHAQAEQCDSSYMRRGDLRSKERKREMRTFLLKYVRPAVMLTVILTIVTGFLYPGLITGLAQVIFHNQANGSLIYDSKGNVIGSELIGQYWTDLKYFHGRPSVT